MTNVPTVVVIGGGVGGVSAIVNLRKFHQQQHTEIVLVEPKDHCELYWAAYRSPFEPWVAEGSLLLLNKFVEAHRVRHVRSIVTKLTKSTAVLANGNTLHYDVAVVATGAAMPEPFLGRGVVVPNKNNENTDNGSREMRLAQLQNYGKELLHAKSVLICGGGLIGTEVAGDIAGYSKRTKNGGNNVDVTLVHAGPHLCHTDLSQNAASMLQRKLEALGVKVILNDKAVENSQGVMTLQRSGEAVQAEKVIYATGLIPQNEFLRNGDFGSSLNDCGWVETDEYFRVKDADGRVFAIGDCSTFLPNAGYQIMDNAKTIGKNLHATIQYLSSQHDSVAPDESKLTKGKASWPVIISTVGPSDGVAYTPAFHTQWVLPFVKHKTMFLFHAKMDLGLTS